MTRTDWTGPTGYRGVLTTLGIMAQAITATSRHPYWKVFASKIITRAGIPENDQLGEARALFGFMRRNIRYTRDPHNFEWLQTPLYTALVKNGDCDCQTTLLASLLMSVGFPVRLVIMGRKPRDPKTGEALQGEANYFHVLLSAEVRDENGKYWLRLDPTIENGFNPPPKGDGITVYKSFSVRPDGSIVEAKESPVMLNGNYTLGDAAADLVRKPDALVITTTKGRTVKVPWALTDLRIVSDADADKWLAELRASGVTTAEIVQIPEVLARAMANPIMARRANLDPGELENFQSLSGNLRSPYESEYFAGLDGLGGFFKSIGKAMKKAVLPVGAVLAAPFTGGLSLAALPAAKALKLKKKKAAGGKLSKREAAALAKAEKESPPSASLEVVPGGKVEAPEIKASTTRNLLLGAGAVGAAGVAGYAIMGRREAA